MSNVINIDKYFIANIIDNQKGNRYEAVLLIRKKYPMDNHWWRLVRDGEYGQASYLLMKKYKDSTECALLGDMLWTG